MPLWFGSEARPLFGWIHGEPSSARRGVVLCPPLGYEAWCSYRTYRNLAERLAARGAVVLRFDYDGTGDSAGAYTDPERVPAWRESTRFAVAELARRGIPDIALVGLRFGATLALSEASASGVETLVLWDPVVSGRRFMRELKVLSMASAESGADEDADGSLEIAGTVHSAETVAAIGQIDVLRAPLQGLRRVLLIDREDRPSASAFVDALRSAGAVVEQRAMPGTAAVLDVPTEDAAIPDAIVNAIVDELTGGEGPARRAGVEKDTPPSFRTKMEWDGATIVEEAVRMGDVGLFGILGSRADHDRADGVVIFLNSGTEHHVGPGRAWVEFTRGMNGRGIATLRADFDGVGDSPLRGGGRTVRPYDPEHLDDVGDFVAFARARGFSKVTVLGLCSGGWMAVQAGLRFDIDAVAAINPQLYWSPGDPVEALLSDTRIRRAPERKRELWGHRYHVWSFLDLAAIRPPAARWLEGIVRRKVRTLLAFAAGDDGIQYLQTRCQRRFQRLLRSQVISMIEVQGIDHPMHRHRKRPEMLAAILGFLEGT